VVLINPQVFEDDRGFLWKHRRLLIFAKAGVLPRRVSSEGPLASLGVTKKEARGDIPYLVLPSDSEASFTSIGTASTGRPLADARGDKKRARGDKKRKLGVTIKSGLGATKK
jgi:hypothetical protein